MFFALISDGPNLSLQPRRYLSSSADLQEARALPGTGLFPPLVPSRLSWICNSPAMLPIARRKSARRAAAEIKEVSESFHFLPEGAVRCPRLGRLMSMAPHSTAKAEGLTGGMRSADRAASGVCAPSSAPINLAKPGQSGNLPTCSPFELSIGSQLR